MRESRIVSPFGKLAAGTVYGGILGLAFGVVFLDVLSADLICNASIRTTYHIQRFKNSGNIWIFNPFFKNWSVNYIFSLLEKDIICVRCYTGYISSIQTGDL